MRGRSDDLTHLALAARDGDRAALAAFVARSQGEVWRFCAHAGPRGDADDLTQEVYLRAIPALARFEGRSSARTWLFAIAHRVCADALRRRRRRWPLGGGRSGDDDRADVRAEHAGAVELWDRVRALDADKRVAFTLTQPSASPTPTPPRSAAARSGPFGRGWPALGRSSSTSWTSPRRPDTRRSGRSGRSRRSGCARWAREGADGSGEPDDLDVTRNRTPRRGDYRWSSSDRRSPSMPRLLRLVAAVAVVATVVLSSVAAASAHVTVNPREAPQGGFAKLTFRVPNERDDASTTSVAVQLPIDHPFASVSVRPTPGWTYAVERAPLATPIDSHGRQISEAVRVITWTGGPIAPGEFQEFDVSVGPLPDDVDRLMFPAVQTYSSGEVVRWIEEARPGQPAPERPAPTLALVAADDGGEGEDGGTSASTTATTGNVNGAGTAEQAADDEDDDGSGNGLAIVALIVGAAGVVAGVGAIAMTRRR